MKHNKQIPATILMMVVMGLAGFAASTASASHLALTIVNTVAGNPQPYCAAPFVFDKNTASCIPCPQGFTYDKATQQCDANTPVTEQVVGVRASASDIETGKVTILADMNLKGTIRTKRLTPTGCHWTHGGFWNSGVGANGKRYSFWDSVPGELCPNRNSPTGWVKVAGGTSGRNCHNIAGEKPVYAVVTGRVIMVRSFANVKIHLHAQAYASATNQNCPGSLATGSGTADITISLTEFVKSRGPIEAELTGDATAKASASATASVQCAPPTTTTVTSTTTTTQTSPPPPPPPPAPTVSATTINDVDAGGSSPNFCVTWNVPGSDSGSLTVTATYGHFSPSGSTGVSGGSSSCQWTYYAPGEVPAGGKDTVTVTLRDNTSGRSATPFSQSFTINPPPPSG